MTRLRILPLALLISLLIPASLNAQETPQPVVAEGSRVRVTVWQSKDGLTATVQRIGSDTLWVLGERASFDTAFPLETIEKLEMSLGRKSNWLKGGLIGGAITTGLSLGWAAIFCMRDDVGYDCDGGEVVAFTAFSAFAGFALGAGIGALSKTERWEEVDVSTLEPVVSLLPQRNHSPAIRIGLRLRL